MGFALGAELLCSFAPLLKKWLVDDDDNNSIAQKAITIAQAVTGTGTINDAVAALTNNPQLTATFNTQIEENNNYFELLVADRQNARKNYESSHKQADLMAERIMRYNVLFAFLVVIAQCGFTYILRDFPALLSTATAACTWVCKHLLDERKEVVGFYFGGALQRDTPIKLK